jgi:DNA helicase II / ATP-dependent DNA helicase PcrA
MTNPSPLQLAIFDSIENENRSLLIDAKAGSGKTTTIVHGASLIPKSQSCLFLAFNKDIATELKSRLPMSVQAKTFHAHCNQALSRHLPHRPRIDSDKVRWILKDNLNEKDFFTYGSFVQRLVSYAKGSALGTHLAELSEENLQTLIDHFSLSLWNEDADEKYAIDLAIQTLRQSNDDRNRIDFDDMLYLCVLEKVRFDKFNIVFVDEAQDTNYVQRWLLHQFLPLRGNAQATGEVVSRLIAVGDPNQAIYGFRGADSDAMDLIGNEFNCKRLPLSVSFRCAKEIVKKAQSLVPDIEAHDNSPLGSVSMLSEYGPEDFSPTGAILCRNVAPLVRFAFDLIRRNVPCKIKGRDIGKGLTTIIEKMKVDDLDLLDEKLTVYREKEVRKALRRGNTAAADAIEDKIDCINIFIEQLDATEQNSRSLVRRIEAMFQEQVSGMLLLCTVHKAKGLEWETVFILDKQLMPSKYAKLDWQLKQEHNLMYVAITRAKLHLKYITSNGWKRKQSQEPTPTPIGFDPEFKSPEQKRREQILATL